MASLAKQMGFRAVFVPEKDAPEAALIPELDIYPARSLNQIVSHFVGGLQIEIFKHTHLPLDDDFVYEGVDFQEVRGQEHVKRALEVAADTTCLCHGQKAIHFTATFTLSGH